MKPNVSTSEKIAFRPDEIPGVFGISRTKVYSLIAEGKLSTVKVGRARLIHRASLDALLQTGAA